MMKKQFEEVMENNLFVFLDDEDNELTYGCDIGSISIDVTYHEETNTFEIYEVNDFKGTEKRRKLKTLKAIERFANKIYQMQLEQ